MQDAYFQRLTHALQQQGQGQAQLIVDAARFKANLMYIQQQLPVHLKPRLAVKSMACMELLQHAADILATQRFMLFHLPHLGLICDQFKKADILMGKPMPIQALIYHHVLVKKYISQIQWLIDSPERLQQYLSFAQQQHLQLRINIEIDVGLHRGGCADLHVFSQMLQVIQAYPQYLKFSGLMGYDAQVEKLPSIIFSAAKLYQKSQQRYQAFIDVLRKALPTLEGLTFNGAGSLTLHHHVQASVCNDVAFGSLLLKPQDFDIPALQTLQSALWIASPVLKKLAQIKLPEMDVLDSLMQSSAVFIYGGYWRGRGVYPSEAKTSRLYGRSSNQEMWTIPKHLKLEVDNYVFIQPAQSEGVIQQFAQLCWYEDDQLTVFKNFRE